MFYLVRPSPFGAVAVLWDNSGGQAKVRRVILSRPGLPADRAVTEAYPEIASAACAGLDALADRMQAFLGGENVVFDLALARNPFPVIVPCHRAIRADGQLGGFQGGMEMKQKLLKLEGVNFRNSRLAGGNRYFY